MNTIQKEQNEVTPSNIEDFSLYSDLKVKLSEETWKVIWEKPIEFDQVKPLEMPLDMFPSSIKNMILDVSNTLETPPDLQAMLSLGVLSTALQTKVTVNPWNSWVEPVNLYLASFLPASSKKSAAFNIMTKPIMDYQFELHKIAKKLSLINKHKIKAYQKLLSNLETKFLETMDDTIFDKMEEISVKIEELDVNPSPLLMLDDATEESLGIEMAENGEKIAFLSSEGSLLDKVKSSKFNIEKSSIYLKAYSNDPQILTRVTRNKNMLKKPHLTICITSQPTVIESFPRDLVERGFLPRFLLSFPYDLSGWREGGIRPGYDPEISSIYNDLILKLLAASPSEGVVNLTYSQAAKERLAEYENWHERRYRGDDIFAHDLHLWAGKFLGQLVRISGLMHVVKELENTPTAVLVYCKIKVQTSAKNLYRVLHYFCA